MSWPFKTLKVLYPFQALFSLLVISLLSGWVSITKSYIYDYESSLKKPISLGLPGDAYTSFVLAFISFIIAGVLCIPNVMRKFGYTLYIFFADLLLASLWLSNAIYISVKANSGSIIDSVNVITANVGSSVNSFSLDQQQQEMASNLGRAILSFEWINFVLWSATTIILYHVRSRRWLNRNDDNRRITICSSYHVDLNSDDQDAKMLTTPKIIKKIDDMLKNPQSVKQSKRSVGSDRIFNMQWTRTLEKRKSTYHESLYFQKRKITGALIMYRD
ncbi:4343_t:CDS:2 [Acaulospora morrowiae]|uniref:4343_t:CDS:1 n=1 Tax=Acaulospora morrowiae TaxID=94023 RepID=A0A9N8W129_9GLOM|nr:4343_t:CDS:2 [Acaulospora morrowiae]